MKKIIIRVMFLAVLATFTAGIVGAETVTASATMQAGVTSVMSLEFYTDGNVLYSYNIPFTNINPTQSMCYADGRAAYDGKSDTGVMCQSNMGSTWYLKMGVASANFPLDHFKFYMGKPWSNVLGGPADGTLYYPDQWNLVPQASSTIYRAGPNDINNYGYGTLATLSFSVNPEGLRSGVSYVIYITYTITTQP